MTARRLLLIPVLIGWATTACRPDPGKPDYPDPDPLTPGATNDDFLDGVDPWEPGEARLSFGLFYEGGASETLVVDDVTRHYYIWDSTYQQAPTLDRIEGMQADELILEGVGWWGGGIAWDVPEDLSAWTTLHLALKSSDSALSTFDVVIGSGMTEAAVSVADHGFVADGSWHGLSIPLTDFAGVDFSAVTAPFSLVGAGGQDGDAVLIDDLYLTAEAP